MLWLQDMGKEQFKFVSEELGREYMGTTTEEPHFPVSGLIHNEDYGRRCICMIVEHAKARIWVPFIIDSGSPNNLLGADALRALGIDPNDIHGGLSVTIHGTKSVGAVHDPASRMLRDINVLGWSYFRRTKNYESMNPETLELTLYKNFAQFKELHDL
jgi:hypothetical protein